MVKTVDGQFDVKLEFEDDSFELTRASISKDGRFSVDTKTVKAPSKIKMVLMRDEQLLEYRCVVEEVAQNIATGVVVKVEN